jgi:hypothetical protein
LSFDPFPFDEDGLATPEVDVGRGQIAEGFVVAPVMSALAERVLKNLEFGERGLPEGR